MGNMNRRYPVEFMGEKYSSAEAMFQCLRFDDEKIREEIRAQKSPMETKAVARANAASMTTKMMSGEDLDNMRVVLRLKITQHPDLLTALMATGEAEIIEDCTKRPQGSGSFWGAALQEDGSWVGENWLGRLWTEIRDEFEGKLPSTLVGNI
jgi:ribA/ribD-fused uncharacterized protein